MAKRTDLKKILIIGSGPIVIGQAAEFDYAGTQACLALKEEGYEVVLVNSNPATIMTDTAIADKVYMEPLTLEYIAKILRYERPDAILPGIGGQTGLNLAMQLEKKGILKECRTELLGTSSESIERAEDRELFKELCQSIGEPTIPSEITYSIEEAKAAAERIGYPVVLRPAFTLGGTGGGFANDEEELYEIGLNAFKLSPVHQVLIEKSVKGYKEIEFEVMRDSNDHAITICGMENIDPVGVHTGDSLVVAPIMTLSDADKKMLNDSAIKIIKELKIEGGCNVQFALDPHSSQYYLIEVNPRVSRSSALASKASGYPIARVTAKIAVGMALEDIKIANTNAAFEPELDYVIAKLPRFPFDKFTTASNHLGTQMKATGEVMGIGSNLEECLLKGIRSLEVGVHHIYHHKFDNMTDDELRAYISEFRDDNIFAIAELIYRGATVEEIHEITKITAFFLQAIKNIVDMEETLKAHVFNLETLTAAKKMGFSDKYVARMWKCSELDVFKFRKENNLFPVFRMVDTCHTGAYIPYFYSSYTGENTSILTDKKKIVVLGAGPIRIGQGVEFDYSTVHAVTTIKNSGYEAIIINNNPETVSTDYTTADKLYFEPLTPEDVMNIIEFEKPEGVVASLGGQTAINLAQPLHDLGVKIIGTDCAAIDRAENRDAFEKLLKELGIPQPEGRAVTRIEDGVAAAAKIGYPVLVRPSFVLGGRAMQIVANDQDLAGVFMDTWQNGDSIPTKTREHGTHVAGLMAAQIGNGWGIAGVASCARPTLYGFATAGVESEIYCGMMHYKYAIALMLAQDVRIINISQALDDVIIFAAQQGNQDAIKLVEKIDKELEIFFKKAIAAGYDFLIVKGAGNTCNDEFVSCPISKESPYGYRKADTDNGERGVSSICSAKYGMITGISDPVVSDHIITVGAAQQNGWSDFWRGTGYTRAEFSNIDCDLYAPGVDILSTVPGDTATGKKGGTSMATPIVSGVAGLIWSVNPDLSSKQVKDILIASASYKALEGGTDFADDEVTIIDAAFAVNCALALTGNSDLAEETNAVLMGAVYTETINNGLKQIDGIPNAQIIVCTASDGKVVEEIYSDEHGGFALFLPEGSYQVSCEDRDQIYERYERTVALTDGSVEYLSISMRKATINQYGRFLLTEAPYADHTNLFQIYEYPIDGYIWFRRDSDSLRSTIITNVPSSIPLVEVETADYAHDGNPHRLTIGIGSIPLDEIVGEHPALGMKFSRDDFIYTTYSPNLSLYSDSESYFYIIDGPENAYLVQESIKFDNVETAGNRYQYKTSDYEPVITESICITNLKTRDYYCLLAEFDPSEDSYEYYERSSEESFSKTLYYEDAENSGWSGELGTRQALVTYARTALEKYGLADRVFSDQSTLGEIRNILCTQTVGDAKDYNLKTDTDLSVTGTVWIGYPLDVDISDAPINTQPSPEEGFVGNRTVEQLRKSIVGSWGTEGSITSDYDFSSNGTCYWYIDKQTEGSYQIRDDKMLIVSFPWTYDRYFWTEESYIEWRSHSSQDCWYMTDSGVLILNGVRYYRGGKDIIG